MNNTNTTEVAQRFETVTCGRCGGTGHYSYCQRYGTICFKCGGRKVVYTKRGAAAAKYLNELLSKPLSEINPGDKIRDLVVSPDGIGTTWATVEEITTEDGVLMLKTNRCHHHGVKPDSIFRVAATKEVKQAALEKAYEYQANLTKAGTQRKR
jgi:hypothetical protein